MGKLSVELTGNTKEEIRKELEKVMSELDKADIAEGALRRLGTDPGTLWKISYET